MKTILFVSNGYGEDTISAAIMEEVSALAPKVDLVAMPLVGDGTIYSQKGIRVVGPRRRMPSDGIIGNFNWTNIMRDLRAGLLSLTLDQAEYLRKSRRRISLCVCVGDLYPVLLTSLFLQAPTLLVGTAKSVYVAPYSLLEIFLLRSCRLVFPRDQPTADRLVSQKVRAVYVGNAMMDSLTFTGEDIGFPSGARVLGILPGSRESAYDDFPVILDTVEVLSREAGFPLEFLVALPNSLDLDRFLQTGSPRSWKLLPGTALSGDSASGVVAILSKNGLRVRVLRERFGDVLASSSVVLGQAGTGNEQAVGLGKPTVAFDRLERGYATWYRSRQKDLLGDAVSVVPDRPSAIAGEVLAILSDPERAARMEEAGKIRMGPPGAAGRIARHILESCNHG
ncbi:MAG: hypothetical protein HYU64_00715 [Armatimonadetes bacterium]|nr:hypothetical protein [Armatimonadota bacterium]